MGRSLGIDQAGDRLNPGDACRDEDGRDDEKPGDALRALRAEQERNRERYRRRRIPEVVDQVREEGDAPAGDEDRELAGRCETEHGERKADSDQALSGSFDARVDQAVGMAVAFVTLVMGMGAVVVVGMGASTMAMKVAAERFVG